MSEIEKSLIFKFLPSVDEVVRRLEKENLPRDLLVETVRDALNQLRRLLLTDGLQTVLGEYVEEQELRKRYINWLATHVMQTLQQDLQSNLRRVINATGVVLHTNLGRAVLSASAIQAVQMAASGYCNIEMDLESGKRGSRYTVVEDVLRKLTGAEASLVVNNNAAAVLLALSTLARGKEVIVSRGQLVEIGGSFRIPEIMAQSGAFLVEVGATNKTHPQDYEQAITENTAMLLHVHMSNYRIVGFTYETSLEKMVQIANLKNIPVMSDLGSGFLVNLEQFGLPPEPTVKEVVAAGTDVVTFSGDKLLGGPQAGIIVGRKKYIEAMKKNPLTRAVRIDKMTMSALEATLREYLYPDRALQQIPTLHMLSLDLYQLEERSKKMVQHLVKAIGNQAEISLERGVSTVGGGAMPTAEVPGIIIGITPGKDISLVSIVEYLRFSEPAVIGKIRENRLLLDLRTVLEHEDAVLVKVLENAFANGGEKD